jgi:hypothetical protein
MNAEVVGKKEICCFYGKLGENVANLSCGRRSVVRHIVSYVLWCRSVNLCVA